MKKDSKAKVVAANAQVMEAFRKEAKRVGVIDFVARSFHVERSLEAVKAAATRKGHSYLRFDIAEEAARK